MDKLTHASIANCIKELDSLAQLVVSGEFSEVEIADWLNEVSWNLNLTFRRRRYVSDEFQHRLSVWIREHAQKQPEPEE